MTMEEEESDLSVPIKALKPSTCNMLGRMLDHENVICNKMGLRRDWRGLAELANFSSEEILKFRSDPERTILVLSAWQEKCLECPTVATLCAFLEKIERFDILDDLTEIFKNDARIFRTLYGNNGMIPQVPVQVPEVDTTIGEDGNSKTPLTVGDTNGVIQQYDAYVCYTEEDQGFLLELRAQLEHKHNLKLCFKDRDLLAGVYEPSAIIRLIQERCRRLLLVITPAFLNSPHLNFQYLYAQALSIEEQQRRIIPIIYKPCQLPSNFRFLARLDYTKNDIFQCFWERLVQSVREIPQCTGQSVMFPPFPSSINSLGSCSFPSLSGSSPNLNVSCSSNAEDTLSSGYGTLSASLELMPVDAHESGQKLGSSSGDATPPSPESIRLRATSTPISFKPPKPKRRIFNYLGRNKQS